MADVTAPDSLSIWRIGPERGFLADPDPLTSLAAVDVPLPAHVTAHLEQLAGELSGLLAAGELRRILNDLPVYDMTPLATVDMRSRERAFQIYAYLASAYVHAAYQDSVKRIPAGVAVPLVALAEQAQRPPILAYASYTLNNWRRLDPDGPISVENLDLVQRFLDVPDAAWFTLIHVEIEAEAAPAVAMIPSAIAAAEQNDLPTLERFFTTVISSLDAMMATFKRMESGCSPDVYYHQVRPYIFSFDDVIFEGVTAYEGRPQSFRGETGAQSTIIPALIAALGLGHEQTGLTRYLTELRAYMPHEHRAFLAAIDRGAIRRCLLTTPSGHPLREAYNTGLRRVLAFRRLHLHYANIYIAQKVADPTGTGGTPFMTWLRQLIDETQAQLLPI